MVIGLLTLRLKISNSHSLKEKRMIIKSLKDRLRHNFNISISEIDDHDKWQLAHLGVVSIGTDGSYINSILSKIVELILKFHAIELIDYRMELL